MAWTLATGALLALGELSYLAAEIGCVILWALGVGGIAAGYRRIGVQVAKRERATARVLYLANHDALTQLPNRHLFFDTLTHALAEPGDEENRTALLSIDLDGFKSINDVLGLDVGDHVLREVAQRLLVQVRETDFVARIGGDEFAVLLTNLADAHVVARLANEILESISAPMHFPGGDLAIGASMGIAFYPDDADGPEGLVRAADAAMREVKDLEKTGFNFAGAGGIATINHPPRENRRASLYG